ncbi:MAG TPA: RluA family pseudouridine synthase [Candidatus Polarisedimenticolaceae bacterium]|nr:RluA family pseudouridine synthase [Candidatus Polarisedimenticolaceae bacterium]
MDLTVLYEDEDVLAIDKPAGLVVHNAETATVQPTVADFARERGVVDTDDERPGIVHRLDKDTSGVMLISKHMEAKAFLQRQFKQRGVEKTYIALLRGRLREPHAIIRLPIGRHRKQPVKRAVIPGGREAVTEYWVRETYPGASLVEIRLHTGRTHQIRVHFSHLGNPVIGDTFYGEKQRPAGLTRQFLHAAKISLELPSGKRVTVESPLPPELESFLQNLGS